ncbi:MAG: hypothetical protein ACM3SP_21795, partial [Chloroflexota bacterium]
MMKRQKQQEKLEALVRDLERELSEGKNQVEAIEETHKRLREAEQICRELADENHRLSTEITSWQERLAKSEENQKQVRMLQQELDTLQAEHARVVESNRQIQENAADSGDVRRVTSAINDSVNTMPLKSKAGSAAVPASDLTAPVKAGGDVDGSSDAALKMLGAQAITMGRIAWNSIVRNWRISAVFVGVLVLMIVGAITLKNSRSEGPISRDPIELTSEATTVKDLTEPPSEPKRKLEPRVRGTFQTVRPTQVFSGPSEDSELIVNIGRGVKVNVVDSRDGWLEIRSKHGRPPGFIRRDAAERIA